MYNDGGYTYKEILEKVLKELEEEELRAYRSGSCDITGILLAEKIVRKHMNIDYA